jgi:hypothetical protein
MDNLLALMEQGVGGVAFNPIDLAPELIAYGEPEAAEALLVMSPDTHQQISVLAGRLLSDNLIIDKAICLAAVQVFEGTPRPLRRKRRVYPKTVQQGRH